MLSIIDIKKALGKDVWIYPLHPESIKSNSVDLHASRFAWSISTKKSIVNNDIITVPPEDTALIYTEESINVSNKIGGSYHSKVTLVSRGFGHIGTCLDAQYIGQSLVAFHNHSKKDQIIHVGEEILTLHLFRLDTPDYPDIKSHDNDPGHPRMLSGFDEVNEYILWRDRNAWATREKELRKIMESSSEFASCKADFKKELDKYNRRLISSKIGRYLAIIASLAVFCILLAIPSYWIDIPGLSGFAKIVLDKLFFPVAVSFVSVFIFADIKKST